MTKSQLVAAVAARTGLPESEAARVMETVEELILEALRRGEKVTIAGFGRFEMRTRSEKAYVNPRTGQHTRLASAMAPGFRPSGAMKRRLGLK